MKKICVAFNSGLVNHLPVKEKVLQRKLRWFYYFLFEVDGKLLVHQRTSKDIWQNLFEFYPFETAIEVAWDEKKLKAWLRDQFGVRSHKLKHISPVQSQQLTHQTIRGQFFKIELPAVPKPLEHYQWVTVKEMKKMAFPRFINAYLQDGLAEKNTGSTRE